MVEVIPARAQHQIVEDVGEGNDAGDAVFLVNHHQSVNFSLDYSLHHAEQRLVLLTLVHSLEPLVAVLVGGLQSHVQIGVGLQGET